MSQRLIGMVGVCLCGLLCWSGLAAASLFCVVDFAGKRCNYPDLDACRQAAGRQGGCVLNEGALVKPVGGAPVCLVESWRTECIYSDRVSCEQRAMATRTVCVDNPNLPGSEAGGRDSPVGQTGVGEGYLPSPFYRPGVER